MARAKTKTKTRTRTEPRIVFLERQIKLALKNAGFEGASIQPVLMGIRKRYLKEVAVYGFDAGKLCRAKLTLLIDWRRFEIHVASGLDKVRVPEDENKAANEVDASVEAFNDLVEMMGLTPKWYVVYADGWDAAQIDQELGLSSGKPIDWAKGQRKTVGGSLKEADEMAVTVEGIFDEVKTSPDDSDEDEENDDHDS